MKSTNLIKKLIKNRRYAFNSKFLNNKKNMNSCVKFFKNYGFCLLENVIPPNKIESIRQEIINAQIQSSQNIKNIQKLVKNKKY